MRNYCIGAVLLDSNAPSTVVARFKQPLISPSEQERSGYLPNGVYFFFSSRRRHTRGSRDWSSDVCSSDLAGRSANLFHQGLLANQTFNKRWNSQLGGDIQIYRNPNQIQLASTQDGLVLLVQPGLGIALSAPLTGTGNATTKPGGVIYTAPGFQVARLTYRLNYAGFTHGDHAFPVTFNVQLARNVATGLNERDAMLAALQVGRITKRGR